MRWFISVALLATGSILAATHWTLRRRLRVAIVDGTSMTPTLGDRDRVLVRRIRPWQVRRGDVALAELAGIRSPRWILKRVAALPGDPAPVGLPGRRVPVGMLVLLGDNADGSVDSRDFGYVPQEWIFGVVVRRLPVAGGAGRTGRP